MRGRLSHAESVLVERCRQGDERAWGDVYREYAPRISRFLRGMFGRGDVDDLVQKVFVEFLSSLGRFRGEASLATWLYRIASNVAKKEIRSRGRYRRKVDAYADHLSERPSAPADGQVLARQRLDLVAHAVAKLDPRFRTVWVMRELEGLSVEETAASLGIRNGTVRTRHHRARERVMVALDGVDFDASEGERRAVGSGVAIAYRGSVGDKQEVLP